MSGCLAFVVALLLVVIAAGQAVANSSLIIGLLATSLPALTAWLYVESIDQEGFEQAHRLVRWIVSIVALTLSLAGFLLMLWNFSRLVVFLIVLESAVWYLEGGLYLSEEKDGSSLVPLGDLALASA